MNSMGWDDLKPIVSYANYLRCDSGYTFGPRIISDHQFIFVAEGSGEVDISEEHFRARTGDLFYYGPQVVHRFEASEADPFAVYGIHFSLRGKLPTSASIRRPSIQDVADVERWITPNEATIGDPGPTQLRIPTYFHFETTWVFDHLSEIVKCYEQEDYICSVQNRILFSQFLVKLHQEIHNQHGSITRSSLLDYVRSQLTERAAEPYEHAWLHEWTQFHSDHVARLFRQQYGVSPHEYHVQEKINVAKKLLAATGLTVTEIAERLHIGTVHYFSRLFKNKTGYVPTVYRKLRQMI